MVASPKFITKPLNAFLSSSDQALDHKVLPFKLPPLTRLMLADVDAGSDTPSLVGKVLKWRKAEAAQGHFIRSSFKHCLWADV